MAGSFALLGLIDIIDLAIAMIYLGMDTRIYFKENKNYNEVEDYFDYLT